MSSRNRDLKIYIQHAENWLRKRGALSEKWTLNLLSATNNYVFKVSSGDTSLYAVKLYVDEGINPNFVKDSNEILAKYLPIQKIIEVDTSKQVIPFDIHLAEYVEGSSLAEVVSSSRLTTALEAEIVELNLNLVEAVKQIRLPLQGFGFYDLKCKSLQTTFKDFLNSYIEKYAGRIESTFEKSEVKKFKLKERLLSQAKFYSNSANDNSHVFSFDNNLKNFLVDEANGTLKLLNVPILGFGSVSQVQASITTNWIGSRIYEKLIYRLQVHDLKELHFFESLVLLGVLAFYAKSGKETLLNANAWGNEFHLWSALIERIG